jgi:hypothetical protein
MNQQARDKLSHLLERTPEDRRPKAKMEGKTRKRFLTPPPRVA